MHVAIDPGLQTGWAIWNNALLDCGLGDPRVSRCHIVANIGRVWIERPVIYPRSKARPNDVIALAVNAGEWGGMYRMRAVDVHYVEPATWKGQLPKEVHHERILAELSPIERDIIQARTRELPASKRHNVLDAVGLALWASKQR